MTISHFARATGLALCLATMASLATNVQAQTAAETDLRFALDAIEKECGELIRAKHIDWRAVGDELSPAAKSADEDAEHLLVLVRLLARLRDGHARVIPCEALANLALPGSQDLVGGGMFWCRSGKKILLKGVQGSAAQLGLEPGSEIVTVDGKPVEAWLDARIETLSDRQSFSSDAHAFFRATHQGLAMPVGTQLELSLKDPSGKAKKRTLTYSKGSAVPFGPAVVPKGLTGDGDVTWAKLDANVGYLHLRRCPEDLPAQVDRALEAVGDAKGLILDFRGNSGGGFDHDEFMGRFVPAGTTLAFGQRYESRGPRQFAGPIVVIVDGTVVSAGETASGIFKEDGRGYLIGESPTAGMSSQKTTIDLPSGKFDLYVSTHSNKARFNAGRGIEGIGVIPHEIVAYGQKDLAAGVDTLIRRASELLAKFPANKVPYRAP